MFIFWKGVEFMFMGNYQNSIDAKGRVIIPVKYRAELGTGCVVTKGIDKCIYIYPVAEWKEFAEKLKTLPKADAKARNFVRHFYGNAEECEVDKQGRLTIPPSLRKYAEVEKDLITIGDGEKIEIWSKEIYETDPAIQYLDGSDIAKGMENYGI